jgi:hypothetical protein
VNRPELRDALAQFVASEYIENVVDLFDRYTAPAVRAKYDQIVDVLDQTPPGPDPADDDPEDEKNYRWGERHGLEIAIRRVRACKP